MEEEENSRKWEVGEQILIEKSIEDEALAGMVNFTDYNKFTNKDIEIVERIEYWTKMGQPPVVGEEIPQIPSMEEDEFIADGEIIASCEIEEDINESSFGGDLVVAHSKQTTKMFDNDSEHNTESLQKIQMEAGETLENLSKTKDQIVVEIARGTLKCVENHEDLFLQYTDELKMLQSKYREQSMIREQNVNHKMEVDDNKDGVEGLNTVFSSHSQRKVEPRKKGPAG